MAIPNADGLSAEDKPSTNDELLTKDALPPRDELYTKVVEILTPYVTSEDAPVHFGEEATLLGDLLINSARLLDIVLDFESEFDIAIDDDQLARLRTVGDAIEIVRQNGSFS